MVKKDSALEVLLLNCFLILAKCCIGGLSLAQPCTNIDIIRQDTRETVEQSVVYLDQDISEVSFSCNYHLSSQGVKLRWLPSNSKTTTAVMRQVYNIRSIAFSQRAKFFVENLTVGDGARSDGFYICTNVVNFACYIGVFQKKHLVPRELRVEYITATSFAFSWKCATNKDYLKGYKLSITTEDSTVVHQETLAHDRETFNRMVPCVQPGKKYYIKVEALYYIRDGQMVTDAFAAVTEVVTPADPSIDHCTVAIPTPQFSISPEFQSGSIKAVISKLPLFDDYTISVPTYAIRLQYRKEQSEMYKDFGVISKNESEVGIDGLELGMMYKVRLTSEISTEKVNISGAMLPVLFVPTASTEQSVMTLNAPGPLVIHAPRQLTSSSFQISWELDSGDLLVADTVQVTAYNVESRVTVARATFNASRTSSCLIKGLTQNSKYRVLIKAENRIGCSPIHKLIVNTLSADVHGAPEMVVADEVTSTSVHLAWCPVGTPNHYLIQYLTSANNTLNSVTTTGPVNSTVIHGLSSFKDYVFTVRGVYGEDDSILSQPISISVKTKPSAPTGIPQSLEVISRSATSVTLTWSLPSSDLRNGDISSYIIQYVVRRALHGSHVVTMDTSECEEAVEYTIDSLEPNTEYVFEVAARNQEGNGPFANIEFQTKKEVIIMTSLPLRQKRALDDVNLESEPETKPHKLDFNNESTKIAFGFGLGVGTIVTMVIGLVLLSLYFCVKRFSSNRLPYETFEDTNSKA